MSRIYLSSPHMGEEERGLLLKAFDSNWIAPVGPDLGAFEAEFCELVQVSHAAALSSGTAALHLALDILGVGEGDEVLTSTLTFAASANSIRYLGAQPVFVDADREGWGMDPALLSEELEACKQRGRLPKAVLCVDLYGQCSDYERIVELCDRYQVPLVEDAAEALGASYRDRAAGTFGCMGIYSFNGNKIITSGGGGMLVSEREEWIERARYLATQARDPAPHYQHSRVGYNYRLSNLLAAVGRGQLRVLGERVERRREINAFYREVLGDLEGVSFMPELPESRSTFWLTAILVDPERTGVDREAIRTHLDELDIEARPVWKPMHTQPVFEDCRVRGGEFSEHLFQRGLCLPSGSNLTQAELDRVVRGIREVIG